MIDIWKSQDGKKNFDSIQATTSNKIESFNIHIYKYIYSYIGNGCQSAEADIHWALDW